MTLNQQFIASMRHLASSVGILATGNKHGNSQGAITISSTSCVSVDPPIISVCVNRNSWINEAIKLNLIFSVSILAQRNLALAQQYSSKHIGVDKMKNDEWSTVDDCPVIKHASIGLICQVSQQLEVATHTVFFGEVIVVNTKEGNPLIYFDRKYRKII